MDKNSRIYIAGHKGLVGGALLRKLKSEDYTNLVYRTHKELDLCNQQKVNEFFAAEQIDYVFVSAAVVGGIEANNSHPGKFLYDNMMITMNVIHAAYKNGIKKLMYLGSNCAYPKLAEQPMKEEALLTGAYEKTNEAYAIAKTAGIRMCEYYNREYGTNFISCISACIYGPGDNFDPVNSHVVPALIRKFYDAKINNIPEVINWGTGTAIREFIYIDDVVDALVFLMNNYIDDRTINIGTGLNHSIADLSNIIQKVVGYEGKVKYDSSKPDGMPQKLLDCTKITKLGWKPKIGFEEGIYSTLKYYVEQAL